MTDTQKLEAIASALRDHSAAVNNDIRSLLAEVNAASSPSHAPSPQSARERLLAELPKHTDWHICVLDINPKVEYREIYDLANEGLVELAEVNGGYLGVRLAPPVEGVDLEGLERDADHFRDHPESAFDNDHEKRLRSAIAALRRRSSALDVSEVEQVRVRLYVAAQELHGQSWAADLRDRLTRWLASRPKAEPVNAELLEAAKAWETAYRKRCPTFAVWLKETQALFDAIARADAATKPSQSKSGEDLGKPDPAARPATIGDVRELVANAIDHRHKHFIETSLAAIRAGDCDPTEPGEYGRLGVE